jgi:hypothetical protein
VAGIANTLFKVLPVARFFGLAKPSSSLEDLKTAKPLRAAGMEMCAFSAVRLACVERIGQP